MKNPLLNHFQQLCSTHRKGIALLIDPDKAGEKRLQPLVALANMYKPDVFLVGGSLVAGTEIHEVVRYIKTHSDIPVILFPGSPTQIVKEADGILFLSLISGRNPELLIGKHVEAAPLLKQTELEILPTGYVLIDCGKPTTANYISHTFPIPYHKPQIAACTALAGEMLGLQLVYLDGGSGADTPISADMVQAVKNQLSIPLMVGGGIRNAEAATQAWHAGADIIVVGTIIEENPDLLEYLCQARYTHTH
ncbi:MAG: geranylgeranylglyceryl/heptaprenylglyceryl phosphate synthase [Bacteroidota bacterium]